MSDKRRSWTLLLSLVLVFVAVAAAVYEHIIPLVPIVLGAAVTTFKKLMTVAFWKQVPLFLGKWSARTVYKLGFRFIFSALTALVVMLLLGRMKRRRIKAWLGLMKERFLVRYQSIMNWFDRLFGFTGVVSFVLSLLIASGMLVWTFIYFDGFAFFIWVGSWGPLAPVWAAIGDFILHRIPFLHRFIAWGSRIWQLYLSAYLPNPFPWLRKRFRRILRHARRVRHMSIEKRTRMWERLRLQREAKKNNS